MLIDILTPLIRSNVPHGFMGMQRARLSPALLDDWFKLILQLKDEIGAWSNKHSKHIPVRGYNSRGCSFTSHHSSLHQC